MLTAKKQTKKLILISLLLVIQFYLAAVLHLFGDEAFYWLESQHLDWSYSELPGWTAWIIGLSTALLGDHYFAVRLPGFLALISTFYCWYLFAISFKGSNGLENLLLAFSMPIFFIVSMMALPDIWMLFCCSWIIYFVSKAVQTQTLKHWILTGIFLAIAINVHLRFWIWLFISGLAWLWLFRSQPQLIRKALSVSLPLGLMGFLPILWFNWEHGFPLFQFQLSERQPWSFQPQNLTFIVTQILVVTPFLFYFWLKACFAKTQNLTLRWVQLSSLLHALLFFSLGLFADGLRTNVHWLLVSYYPLLATLNLYTKPTKNLRVLAIFTSLATLILLALFISTSQSNLKSKWVQNSSYWKTLSQAVETSLVENNLEQIIADHFMTTAELTFELRDKHDKYSIKSLPHALNDKHGRSKQLEIMNLIQQLPDNGEPSLLVIENSAVKLQNQDDFYQTLCANFTSLRLIKSLNDAASKKQYHLFVTNDSEACELPATFYIEHQNQGENIIVSGWVMLPEEPNALSALKIQGREAKIKLKTTNSSFEPFDLTHSFPFLGRNLKHHKEFSIQLPKTAAQSQIQLQIIDKQQKTYLSPIYNLD